MVESPCVMAFSITLFCFLFSGIFLWFFMSVYKQEPQILPSQSSCFWWNLISSSTLLVSVLAAPLIYFLYKKGYRGLSTFFLLVQLVITGPVLLGLNLLGSYMQALNSLIVKVYPNVIFSQYLCNIMRDLHWSVLYFISLISTAVLIFCYYIYCQRYIFNQNFASLLPLRTLIVKSSEECPICLEDIQEGAEGSEIKRCGHLFHKRCIENWIDINPRCPICRIVVQY